MSETENSCDQIVISWTRKEFEKMVGVPVEDDVWAVLVRGTDWKEWSQITDVVWDRWVWADQERASTARRGQDKGTDMQ